MSSYFSVLSGWLIPITRALEAWQIDLNQVVEQCQLKPEDFRDPESRLSVEKTAQIIDYCNKVSNRKDFAIEVAKQFHPSTFHALGYAMMSSDSLMDAFQRIARYKRVVSNTCALHVENKAVNTYFIMDVFVYEDSKRPVISHDCVMTFLATIVQFVRETLKSDISPSKLCLNWPKPSFNLDSLSQYFNCPVEFDCENIALVYSQEVLNKKLIGGNPLLTQTHEKMLDEILSRIDRDDVAHMVKSKIQEMLPLGTPSQTDIASQMGMSLRNLQRKLQERETSFRELLENTRKKLALEYIQQNHLSYSEIGYLVGFSNIGNFNRAFKRWTDCTPGVYRKNNSNMLESNATETV